jgi:phage-related protein (TIGR01555 family)
MGKHDMTKKRNQVSVKTADASSQKHADGLANFTARVGLGTDNVLSAGTYVPFQITINRVLLENIYRTSWIGGKVIDDYAQDMIRAGIDITSPDTPDDVHALQRYMIKMGIWGGLTDCLKWSRLYGGAIGVLDIEGQALDTPLRVETVAKDQFKGIVVYDRWQISPDLTRTIQSGKDIGLPEYYRIVTGWNNRGKANAYGQSIHHSRVLRFVGIKLPYFQAITLEMWGESILERMYDRLISYDTTTMGAANLVQKAYLRQIGVKNLRDILAAGGKAEENLITMFSYIRQLQTNEGLTLLDSEDTMTYNSYTFSGLDNVLLQFGQQISGACGIPLVRLFGQSPAGLSSTGDSDIRNYYDSINAQQELNLRQPLDLLLSVCYRSKFGKPRPESMDFDFAPLWQMSATEKFAMAKTAAETIDIAHAAGAISDEIATKEYASISKETGLFTNITPEYITEVENEPPMPKVETVEPVIP